jgi:hypothetical protein
MISCTAENPLLIQRILNEKVIVAGVAGYGRHYFYGRQH